jgi:hypothetical protein
MWILKHGYVCRSKMSPFQRCIHNIG